jgi:hypothetical protein
VVGLTLMLPVLRWCFVLDAEEELPWILDLVCYKFDLLKTPSSSSISTYALTIKAYSRTWNKTTGASLISCHVAN